MAQVRSCSLSQSIGSRDGGTQERLELFLVGELVGLSNWSHVGVMVESQD